MRQLVAILALLLCTPIYAQIVYVQPPPPTSYVEYTGKLPDGVTPIFNWSADVGITMLVPEDPGPRVDVSKVAPGKHLAYLDLWTAKLVGDKIKVDPKPQHWSVTLDGGVEPPAPPKLDIAKLAGKDAATLSQFNTLFAAQLEVTTQAAFLKAYANALGELGSNAAIPEITRRLTAASAEPIKADAVRAELLAIAKDLGPGPPPTPEQGPRRVVILHENDQDTSAIGAEFAALRVGEFGKWFKDNGHELLILDQNQVDQAGRPVKLVQDLLARNVPLPALYVLDPKTNAVLFQEQLPAPASAVVDAVKGH